VSLAPLRLWLTRLKLTGSCVEAHAQTEF